MPNLTASPDVLHDSFRRALARVRPAKEPTTLIAIRIPTTLVAQLDRLARDADSDRSKLIRSAIRKATSKSA